MMAQLGDEQIRSFQHALLGDCDHLDFDPARIRNPLRGETLYVLDSMMGSVDKKMTNDIDPFVVRDVGSRFLAEWLEIEVL